MNKTIVVVGGIIIIAAIAGYVFLQSGDTGSIFNFNNATTTPPVVTPPVTPPVVVPQTPGAPIATTNAKVAPTDTTVVVTGTVVPKGAITSYWYEYGVTVNLGSKTGSQVVGSGYTAIQTPALIKGLTKNTTYYFRLVAENQYGKSTGAQSSVKTTQGVPDPVVVIPTVKSLAAGNILATSATLNGEVNPNKASTQYWFEYGSSANLGNTTALSSVGSGSVALHAGASITNLKSGTTYFYRLNAQNQFGTVNGSILTFKTSGTAATPPTASTRSTASILATSATLRGNVDPNGTETKYWFEYSTDTLLGAALLKSTAQKSAGNGTNQVAVETDITSLVPNTTYFARIVAQSSEGTVRGDKVSFKTK